MKRARSAVCSVLAILAVVTAGSASVGPPAAGSPAAAPSVGRPVVETTTITYGPFRVPAAMGMDEPGMLTNAFVREGGCQVLPCRDLVVQKPCEDCFITRMVPNLVDPSTGEVINFHNGGMLHHVVNVNWAAPDETCPPGQGGLIGVLGALEGGNERFFASGNERTVFEVPRGYGLPVSADDDWGLIVDLMNMTMAPRDMALEYTFTWVPASARLKPVTPVWLDIDNCGDSEVDLPHGYSDTEWDWTSTVDGRIMALAGHVHDDGISVAAENVTRGKVICTSLAGYEEGSTEAPMLGGGSGVDALHPVDWWHMVESDHPTVDLAGYQGHIAGATGCVPRQRIRPGDTIRLHAQYQMDHMGHGGHDGAMGIMVAYVHERP